MQLDPRYPPLLFVALGEVEDAQAFFARFFPGARAICDPEQLLYAAFGLGHGSLRAFLAPSVFRAGLRALFKGSTLGRVSGDVLTMAGTFFVHAGRVRWSHYSQHVGDHPDWAALPAQLAALR